jgi:hypothetical protein
MVGLLYSLLIKEYLVLIEYKSGLVRVILEVAAIAQQ